MKSDLKKYEGVIVPMVTPVNADYSIDKKAVGKIINSFIDAKVLPFVLGTTGEVASLSPSQKTTLVKEAVDAVDGRAPLFAGLAGNSILQTIDEAKRYTDMGVNALVALAPNYYPIEAKHALKWFEKLADSVTLPLFLYNIPATTHHSISLDVVETMSHHPNIVGIKDSENNQTRLEESLERWASREDFLFLVGWAAMSAFGLKRGANGIVPSAANLIPELYAGLYEAAKNNDFVEAERIQGLTDKVSAYNQSGRTVTEAIPALKALMSLKGLCGTQVMPPMLQMEEAELKAYLDEMENKILNLA
ncbi:dihydrodipicolinate synthase family protein [Maribellus sediminis]|uniref:dihydrodipicolinate synthase family protein n=1 Tax=Maribellus sediminis TaxID=2696285 RepID=UPI001430A49B|nr:dihydrodipicolinate synthase family protein [Maribellus sediminis]